MGTLLWGGAVWPDLSDGRSLSSKFVGADEMFAKMVVQAIESVKVRLHGWIGRVFCCCDFGEKYNCEEGMHTATLASRLALASRQGCVRDGRRRIGRE